MKALKNAGIWVSFLGLLFIQMGSAQAAMVSTSEIVHQLDRTQVVSALERQDVQQQLTEMGVDPVAALARVDNMTDQEIVQLNGHLTELTAGAGVSTFELLLIIILIIIIL
jgi:alkylation response protein AidB-like acyl-CoA dehydrogenase